MKIICYALAITAILLPNSLLAESRTFSFSTSEKAESALRRRNEVQESWDRQYKSYSPSDSKRELRESKSANEDRKMKQWWATYEVPEARTMRREQVKARRNQENSRRNQESSRRSGE